MDVVLGAAGSWCVEQGTGAQVVAARGVRRWPAGAVAPGIVTGGEVPHHGVMFRRREVTQVPAEELEQYRSVRHRTTGGQGGEVTLPGRPCVGRVVRPRTGHHPVRPRLALQRQEQRHHGRRHPVAQPHDLQQRHRHLLRPQVQALPQRVTRLVGHLAAHLGGDDEGGVVQVGQRADDVPGVGGHEGPAPLDVHPLAVDGVHSVAEVPRRQETQLERATGAQHPVVEPAARHPHCGRLQVRRCGSYGLIRGNPHVGGAVHPHPAVAPRLRRGPLDGVISVVGLVHEGLPLPARGEATAHVLHQYGVALRRQMCGVGNQVHHQLSRQGAVRGAVHQHRMRIVTGGQVEVGVQHHTVAHGDADLTARAGRRRTVRHRERVSAMPYWWIRR